MESGTEVCDRSWISPLSSPSRKTSASKKFPESTRNYENKKGRVDSSPTSIMECFQQDAKEPMELDATARNASNVSVVASVESTKVKSLIKGRSWDLPKGTKYASEIKETLSANSTIAVEDIMLVENGRELLGENEICANRVIYAMVRTKASSKVSLTLSVSNGKNKSNLEFTSSVGSKIYQVKRELRKLCNFSEFAMRCIIGGRVLKDENMLGDYILSNALSDSKTRKKGTKNITLYVTKTVNLKKDVDIHFHLLGGTVLKSYFEIQSPTCGLREVLKGKLPFAPHIQLKFCMNLSHTLVQLDPDKCLFDYGVTGEKVVDVYVVPSYVPVPTTRDLSSNFTMRLDPKSLFSTVKESNSISSMNVTTRKSSSNESKEVVGSICKKMDSLANAIALKTKSQKGTKSFILSTEAPKEGNSKSNKDRGLFSKMKKGFLSKSKKSVFDSGIHNTNTMQEAEKFTNVDNINPYDDPDSPLNQMD